MMQISPPFIPVFGSGPPTANTSTAMPYFDTSTNPYTAYIYQNAAWHAYGEAGAINATSIQGVAVAATVPTTGQFLKFNGTQWAPG